MSEPLNPQPNGAAAAPADGEPHVREAMTSFMREARVALEDLAEDLLAKARLGYGMVRSQAKERSQQTVEMVREKPYAAMGAAVGIGFLVGHLFSASRTHVIYLRDGRHGL